MTERKLLVLGIGNLIMGDEGVGVHVIQELQKEQWPECVEVFDGATGGFYLLESMQEADRIVLIDAAAFDDPIGSIRQLAPKYSKHYPKTLTAHDVGLKDLLDSFYMLEQESDIRLIAITIDPHQSLSMELSPPVAAVLDDVVELVRGEIAGFLAENPVPG